MPYYVRAFCTATQPPTINTVMQSLRQRGSDFTAQVDDASELNSPVWGQFELIYKPGNGPIVVECNRDQGDKSLAKAECQEFVDEVMDLEDAPAPAKGQVVGHLRKTRFIISCQLLSDCDEDGYEANGQFLDYFVEHCGAMIQADGEGFYERMDTGEILLSLK
jgi:hypothetical protein